MIMRNAPMGKLAVGFKLAMRGEEAHPSCAGCPKPPPPRVQCVLVATSQFGTAVFCMALFERLFVSWLLYNSFGFSLRGSSCRGFSKTVLASQFFLF